MSLINLIARHFRSADPAVEPAPLSEAPLILRPRIGKLAHCVHMEFTTLKSVEGQPLAKLLTKRIFKDANHHGVMVAFRVPFVIAHRLAVKGGEPPADLHLTLAYLGDADDFEPEQLQSLYEAVSALAKRSMPLRGRISGLGMFSDSADGQRVLYASFDSPQLPAFRHAVVTAIESCGVSLTGEHGFTPHITLAYLDADEDFSTTNLPDAIAIEFEFVCLAMGGTEIQMRLKGKVDAHGDKPPQPLLPIDATFTNLMRPFSKTDTDEDLTAWLKKMSRADTVAVQPIPAGKRCVVVKSGSVQAIGIEGLEGDARLDDLLVALRRIEHDYAFEGVIAARDLDGVWIADPEVLDSVFRAEITATPIVFPLDLFVLDGDISQKPFSERWQLLRALFPVVGGHAIVPPSFVARAAAIGNARENALEWDPSEGVGMLTAGTRFVKLDSVYTFGKTNDLAEQANVTMRKDYGAGGGVSASPETFSTADLRGGLLAPGQGVFRKPRREKDVSADVSVGIPMTLLPEQDSRRRVIEPKVSFPLADKNRKRSKRS